MQIDELVGDVFRPVKLPVEGFFFIALNCLRIRLCFTQVFDRLLEAYHLDLVVDRSSHGVVEEGEKKVGGLLG
jgi:hypothetical protein